MTDIDRLKGIVRAEVRRMTEAGKKKQRDASAFMNAIKIQHSKAEDLADQLWSEGHDDVAALVEKVVDAWDEVKLALRKGVSHDPMSEPSKL